MIGEVLDPQSRSGFTFFLTPRSSSSACIQLCATGQLCRSGPEKMKRKKRPINVLVGEEEEEGKEGRREAIEGDSDI